jgi:hypothetical protein
MAKKREAKGITEERLADLVGQDVIHRTEAGKGLTNSDIAEVAEALAKARRRRW